MESYTISNKKEFMAKFLKSDLFDLFEVREIILHTAFKMILDGKRNKDYFCETDETAASDYLTWHEMRKYVYELIQGNKPPSYFKIVLSADSQKTSSLSEDVSTFYLNVQFKDNVITCSTGSSYKNFTLDQSADKIWDKSISDFLFQHHFI